MTERPGIYAITHSASGRVYVGSASNISKRWSRHRKDLECGEHRNAHLQAAWDRHGPDAFAFEVLELTGDLTAREQWWMDRLDAYTAGFNLCPVARSSRGRKWSDSERESRACIVRRPESAASLERRKVRSRAMARSQRKLSLAQADELRARYGTPPGQRRQHQRTGGRPTLQALASEYGISIGVAHGIVHRKAYAA